MLVCDRCGWKSTAEQPVNRMVVGFRVQDMDLSQHASIITPVLAEGDFCARCRKAIHDAIQGVFRQVTDSSGRVIG